jgi:uncharacterized protein YecE (DUF72 family)
LEYLARRFDTVELNSTFYSLKRPSDFRAWADQTPADFEFAVKGGRYITHLKQLHDVETALANFFASGVLVLGERLGPFLWQLPSRTRFNPDRIEAFLKLLPRSTPAAAHLAERHDDKVPDALTSADVDVPLRQALEARHESFRTAEVLELLRSHDVALVMSHSAETFPYFEELTSDLVYIRLHGSQKLYVGSYTDDELDEWARKVKHWSAERDVRVYFDNDTEAAAPFDALRLRGRLKRGGGVSGRLPNGQPASG